MNVLRNPNFSVAFRDNFAIFSDFQKFMSFLEKPICILRKTQLLKVLRSFTKLVAFPRLIVTISILKKSSFFRKNQFFLCKKIKLWTFWDFLLFRSHSTANMLWLAEYKKKEFFFPKTHFFEITQSYERFEKSYYFNRILRQIFYFHRFLRSSLFQKIHHLFKKKKWTFEEILNFQSHSATILLSLATFNKSCFFLEKPI